METELKATAERLEWLVDNIPQMIGLIPAEEFSHKPSGDKWSKKEILGHLADSAAINHQRFVRAQFEQDPLITYDQDKWNKHNYYQELESQHIIAFWEVYNRHLLMIIKRLPADALQRTCRTGGDEPHSLAWLIQDYLVHMEHHLRQIVAY